MKKAIITPLLLFIIAVGNQAFSQQKNAQISFDKDVHDFGQIKEDDGSTSCTFTFTNTGSEPLVIQRVAASCGCTSPDWTKAPVAPGKTGFVKATFDPRRRPGAFDKHINVFSNSEGSPHMLRIKGEVIPRTLTVEEQYPFEMGALRFKMNHIAFARMFKGDQKLNNVQVINTSDKPQKIIFERVPDHIKITCKPETIKPGGTAVIDATFDTEKVNDWGFVMTRIPMKIGTDNIPYTLTISASIEENFSNLSEEELAKSPVIEFENRTFDFGEMKQNSSVKHKFVFKNEGKSDLIIRKVKATCGCTAVSPPNTVIKPGEESHIEATFNSGSYKNRQNKSITVTTNDPKHSTIILRITGVVKEES